MLDLENERIMIKQIGSTINDFNEVCNNIQSTFENLESDISNLYDILEKLQDFESDIEKKKRDLLIDWCWINLQFDNSPETWRDTFIDDILNGYNGNAHMHDRKAITYSEIRSKFGL